jgi:hypothetical protein
MSEITMALDGIVLAMLVYMFLRFGRSKLKLTKLEQFKKMKKNVVFMITWSVKIMCGLAAIELVNTYGLNLIPIVAAGILLVPVFLPFKKEGYYRMYRIVFPLSLIMAGYIIITIGPIADLIRKFQADMARSDAFEALKVNASSIVILAVILIISYYIWTRILVDIPFPRVKRVDSEGFASEDLGRMFWRGDNKGKYAVYSWKMNEYIVNISINLMRYKKLKMRAVKNEPQPMPLTIFMSQGGFPFFHPRKRMKKLTGIHIINTDLPGMVGVTFPGHLEALNENHYVPHIGTVGMDDKLYIDEYRVGCDGNLDRQSTRTQGAVNLDAELNKQRMISSTGFLPQHIKDEFDKLDKKKEAPA